ncbi:uncharacterized protein LOC129298519 [Prosopis cineraria]|uniref:uncharacterized protein LOC129298519 n=1 Tax=Prosopis cineraria TaxID=364024 RepID=UPI00240E9D29|nr:uncharacterized protein LOC129298519 [Prosopis cineraria]
MGMVVVISLPLILFCLILGFGCYFLGRARGRQDIKTNPQVFGVPTPPTNSFPSPPPPPHHSKPDNTDNV